MTIRRICVFCGSRVGGNARYAEAARELGSLLERRGLGLVYGGGRVGLMGVIADAVLAAGGEVIGVIPQALATDELLHTGATVMHVVASMHERKALMAELSQAFIALPGGFGTFEELLEIITWAQLGMHHKPIGLLDTAGYFGPLLNLFDHAIAEGFIKVKQRQLVISAPEPEELLGLLSQHTPPVERLRIRPEET
jgi:uncharacterized protein (TIGR00730 family)